MISLHQPILDQSTHYYYQNEEKDLFFSFLITIITFSVISSFQEDTETADVQIAFPMFPRSADGAKFHVMMSREKKTPCAYVYGYVFTRTRCLPNLSNISAAAQATTAFQPNAKRMTLFCVLSHCGGASPLFLCGLSSERLNRFLCFLKNPIIAHPETQNLRD